MSVLILISFLILNIFKTSFNIYTFYNSVKTSCFFSFQDYYIFFILNLVKSTTFLKYLLMNFCL